MQEDIIYKLKTLQSIEPEAAWRADKKRKLIEKISVFGVQNDIFLSAGDIYTEKSKFSFASLMPSRLAVSLTSFALILTSGIFTVGASQSSLPGETLYPVKKASEQMKLALTSDQNKPRVEIEQAGKRLEELAEISKKSSDVNQNEKVETLVAEFQAKVDSANTHLGELSEKGKTDSTVKVAGVAKIVNEQSEKYTNVLKTTTEGLPTTVKERVATKVADAAKTTAKTNISALMVMIETQKEEDVEEIAAKVQKTVEEAQAKVSALSAQTAAAVETQTACSEEDVKNDTAAADSICTSKDTNAGNVVIAEEASRKLEEARENLKNSNLTDTLKSVSEVTEITAQVNTVPLPVVSSDPVTEAAPITIGTSATK
ncbi:MAG: DUF5667 domain-containing protein [Candidatus Paceibacterota bacterium]